MYEVIITMSNATVEALKQNGFSLYVFRAATTSGSRAVPLIWMRMDDYAEQTQLAFNDEYGAYISNLLNQQGVTILTSSTIPADLGRMVIVDDSEKLSLGGQGAPGAISIVNRGTMELTAGICALTSAGLAPTVAMPLFGGAEVTASPVGTVMLMFSGFGMNAGTVLTQSNGPGMLLHLSDAVEQPHVTFDINAGWSGAGVTPVSAASDLGPILLSA